MFRRGRSGGDEATVVAVARPIVTRAATDPEFHQALQRAFSTGRKVTVLARGRRPVDVARALGRDRKLQDEIEDSAVLLQEAVSRVVAPERSCGKGRGGLVAMIAAGAAVLALAPLVVRKLRGDFS